VVKLVPSTEVFPIVALAVIVAIAVVELVQTRTVFRFLLIEEFAAAIVAAIVAAIAAKAVLG